MYKPVLLTDLDNTIYNWVDFFAPSFRAMVHVLAKETKIEEEAIIKDFKHVYNKRASLEYSFSVQELKIFQKLPKDEVENLIRIAKGTFSRVREKNLKPYDGVKETLKWIREGGTEIVGVTNAPLFHAEMRLKQLRLDSLFTGLAGWEGHGIPNRYLTKKIKERIEENRYKSRIKHKWELSKEELKPNPFCYLRVINELHISHKAAYVIGDSLYKDIKPAIEIGAIGILAKYGKDFSTKNFQTLLKITNWDKEKISNVYDKKSIIPTFTVNSFSEIRKIVQPPQLRLKGL